MTLNVDYETKDSGYVTTNSVRLTTRNIALVSQIIALALTSGATDASDLDFYSDDTEQAYLDALKSATTIARRRAVSAAEAAGGRLGNMLSMTAQEPVAGAMVQANRIAMVTTSQRGPASISIQAPVVNVNASVSIRYEFIPTP